MIPVKYFAEDDPKGTVLAYKSYDYMEMMGDKTVRKCCTTGWDRQ